jgi:hypothetical protein
MFFRQAKYSDSDLEEKKFTTEDAESAEAEKGDCPGQGVKRFLSWGV